MISLLFSLLATSILPFKFPTESLKFSLPTLISSIVGVSIDSISDDSLANIGKLELLSALATKTVFSTSDFGVTKKLLYKSLAPNCIVAQEAFGFCFFSSLTVDFAIWLFVMTSFCFSTSCILFSSENALVPFIKKRTASPIEYLTFSYLFAIDRRFFSIVSRLLLFILIPPKNLKHNFL